ncbi:MAG: S8 family serine peptidase [Myxococcota bacterium]
MVVRAIALLALVAACGEGGDVPDDPDDPIVPRYGANAFAYEALGFDDLLATGLTGSGVSVCVVDTGIDAAHPAFAHVVERGRLEWADFTAEAAREPVDTNGHGTHVAGIIAMNERLTGGAPNVRLLVARVFTDEGGASNQDIAEAVDWCRQRGADVISMSLGGLTYPLIQELLAEDASASEAAVERAIDAGIYVVAAAGNTEVNRDVATPANVPGVLAVGALDADAETKARFSQSGLNEGPLVGVREDPDRKPETSAPGVSITSAMAPGSTLSRDVEGCRALYCALDGTSQATPFVSAALALVLEAVPELQHDRASEVSTSVRRMKEALAASASFLPGQDLPHDDGVGYGRMNAPALLAQLQRGDE